MSDLVLVDRVKEIQKAVEGAKEMILQAPLPSRDEGMKLMYAHAIVLQQATMALLMESNTMSGHKQLVRMELAAKLGREATTAFGILLKLMPEEKVISQVEVSE